MWKDMCFHGHVSNRNDKHQHSSYPAPERKTGERWSWAGHPGGMLPFPDWMVKPQANYFLHCLLCLHYLCYLLEISSVMATLSKCSEWRLTGKETSFWTPRCQNLSSCCWFYQGLFVWISLFDCVSPWSFLSFPPCLTPQQPVPHINLLQSLH